jgi:hypothetical protein
VICDLYAEIATAEREPRGERGGEKILSLFKFEEPMMSDAFII